MRYEIREMLSVRRQVYGRLLYVTNDFEDALDHLVIIQRKEKNGNVGLLIAREQHHEEASDGEDKGSGTNDLL